ncbi:PepSY-associated TM helix domain-containing protein [Mucilaginibacter sp. dw_454]|uniref:PepSY-associated TM helix domain-containing protein n=1 Tax=Mucilaginibacter sp. dw_454 TaxID=2720079 RepID=UPI001BD34F46|nr:PepSY-associated TM helix domain-containing protein [Mucilaginibacter sp. dw_454]
MSPLKKTILFIHRWLGFISGLVVVIVSITGCLYVFQDEIQDALCDYRKVAIEQKPFLLPSQLQQIAFEYYPTAEKNPVIGYYGNDRPAIVMMTVPKLGSRYIYLNPYSGRFLHDENIDRNFFVIVEYIHLYLLLPPAVGGQIVGWSVVIFVVLMITGIILWWPKRKSDRKRSFTIKWNGRWRRVNYDLHNVLGFYACSIALILAFTGLSICFDWVTKGINKTANLGKTYANEERIPVSDSLHKPQTTINSWDKSYLYARQHSPQAGMFVLYGDSKKAANTVTINAYYTPLHYYKSDSYEFDQFSAKLLKVLMHQSKSAGLKLNDMNYDIHVGQILGLTGKIIAFLASLICASLPITGFVIWWGKRSKSKGKKVKQVVHRRTHKQVAMK